MAESVLVAPHSLEAEKAVLGALLRDPERLDDAADALRPEDFFRDAHTRIFRAALHLHQHGGAVDPLTLADRLMGTGELEAVGGRAYICSLTDGVPRSTNVEHYARIVKEKSTRRQLIHAANRMLTAAYQGEEAADLILDEAQRAVFEIGQDAVRGDFVDAAQLVREGFPAVEKLFEEKRGVTGIASGLADLDDMTRGFQPGTLTLIAGRPAMGKTALALNVAYAAARAGKVVGLFSVEMSRQEVFMRLLTSVGRVDGHRLQTGYVNPIDYGRVSAAMTEIGTTGLYVDDSPKLNALDVRGKGRRLRARRGLDLLIIDYLQIMEMPKTKVENRNLAVAEVSRALKLVARELEVPVIALSQLSRGLETRTEKKPMLSDLRDSGALEQDADLVLFIHRPEVYGETPENRGRAEIVIAKQRNGRTGTVPAAWLKEQQRFCNWSER